MGYIRVVALVIASVALFFSMIPGAHAAESKQYKELLEKQNSALIIPFEYKDFNRYVMKNPGDYQIIMFYTLSDRCPQCISAEGELEQVANSYIAAGKHYGNEGELPIFFARIEYTQANQEAFKLSGYTSVPVLTVANLELAETYKKTGKLDYAVKYEWKITSMDFTDAGKLIEHVNKVTDAKVDLRFTFGRNLFGASIILAALFFIFFIRQYISDFIRNKVAWNVVSAIVFVQCVGGLAFTLIHSVPTFKYGYDSSGSLVIEEFFQRNQRQQYGGEGYIASIIMFIAASALIAFTQMYKVKNPFSREILCLVCIGVAFTGFTVVHSIFIMKSPTYNPRMYPPDHYMDGPLSVDQGTTI